jgi:peptidoglycan/LPS O-acetylase OafA/YrhL
MAQTFHLDRYPALALPVTFAAAFLLAFLSWNILEKPFLGLKRFFKSKPLPWDTTASSPLTTAPPGIDLPH